MLFVYSYSRNQFFELKITYSLHYSSKNSWKLRIHQIVVSPQFPPKKHFDLDCQDSLPGGDSSVEQDMALPNISWLTSATNQLHFSGIP